MKQRDVALKAFLKSQTNTAMAIYKGLRNRVTKELRDAKATYYITMITEAKGNNSLIWKQTNSLLKSQDNIKNDVHELKIGNVIISENRQLAKAFHEYFIGSVEELANNFKQPG